MFFREMISETKLNIITRYARNHLRVSSHNMLSDKITSGYTIILMIAGHIFT